MAEENEDNDNFGCLPDMSDVPEMIKPMIIEQAVHVAMVVLDELEKEGTLFEIVGNWSREQTAKHTKAIAIKHLEEGHE